MANEIDFYKRLREADQRLTEAIANSEGSCRIAYLEDLVETARKRAEAEELEYLEAQNQNS